MPVGTLSLFVKSVTYETADIRVYDLRSPDGAELPSFTAGAYIDIHLPERVTRSYSLVNSQHDSKRYVIGVAKDRNSRGGSSYIHKLLSAGDTITVTPPKNNFALDEREHDTILIAGGIGVTPMMSMIDRLQHLERRWQLYFATRNRESTPFQAELESYMGSVKVHCDDEHGGRLLDIGNVIASAHPGSHFYCCGPSAMLAAFKAAAGGVSPEHTHLEHFSATESVAVEGGFHIELARSARTLLVRQGKTVLDVLLEAGVDVPFSCQAGVCGVCQTKVLSGIPDHRDLFLSPKEQSSNETMMVCCSGSNSEKLVLDL